MLILIFTLTCEYLNPEVLVGNLNSVCVNMDLKLEPRTRLRHRGSLYRAWCEMATEERFLQLITAKVRSRFFGIPLNVIVGEVLYERESDVNDSDNSREVLISKLRKPLKTADGVIPRSKVGFCSSCHYNSAYNCERLGSDRVKRFGRFSREADLSDKIPNDYPHN